MAFWNMPILNKTRKPSWRKVKRATALLIILHIVEIAGNPSPVHSTSDPPVLLG